MEPHYHRNKKIRPTDLHLHAFDFSWSLWLAAWVAGTCDLPMTRYDDIVQHGSHTPEIG